MNLPINIQTYILNILYQYNEIYRTDVYLVNKHFFSVYKSLVGSYIGFFIDSQEDILKFQSFINFVKSRDQLYNRPYFIYEKLNTLSICILEAEKGGDVIVRILSTLLNSKQWKEWNRELISSNQNRGIDVEVIDPFNELLFQFDDLGKSEQITHLDIHFDLESECSTPPPPNIKTLNLTTYEDVNDEPDVLYEDVMMEIIKNCKHITKLRIVSPYCDISRNSQTLKLFNSLGGQLTRLEIFNKGIIDDDGYSKLVIPFLKEHPNINEFGIDMHFFPHSRRYEKESLNIVDYLLSEECHIETITHLELYSNSIPSIKRRIPFMIVTLYMITDFDKNRRINDPDINKKVLQQQIDKAVIEFRNVDHLILTYCNSHNDHFSKKDFHALASAVKDHNSSLNKIVRIHFQLIPYALIHDDFKVLKINKVRFPCDEDSQDSENEDENEYEDDGEENESQEDESSS